jgi:hypothetical protein
VRQHLEPELAVNVEAMQAARSSGAAGPPDEATVRKQRRKPFANVFQLGGTASAPQRCADILDELIKFVVHVATLAYRYDH